MSSVKATTLDHRLYAWLLEPDDAKFERAFNAYFSIAFPSVLRHLTRIARWDPSQLEELAQDALLKFFDRAGRGRREASQIVEYTLASLRPLRIGPFHERQVTHWIQDVSSFRVAAMSFAPPPADESDAGNWKVPIHALTEQIPALQRQGCHILYALRLEIHWHGADEEPAEAASTDTDEVAEVLDELGKDAGEHFASVKTFAVTLVNEATAKTARLEAAAATYPGIVRFVDGTFTIITVMSRLRIPTNGYLFEIAMTLYLDECKKRGRRKRGGTGMASTLYSPSSVTEGEIASQHPLDLVSLDPEPGSDGEERWEDSGSICARGDASSTFVSPGFDPTPQYEQEDLFERFYDYLRKPVADAIEEHEEAQGTRRERAERHKLDSLTAKFDRTTAVIALLGEGYTQERTAERLGLSRNQVKYIIELVQEAYTRFTATSGRAPSANPPHMGEQSNAR